MIKIHIKELNKILSNLYLPKIIKKYSPCELKLK